MVEVGEILIALKTNSTKTDCVLHLPQLDLE